MPEGVAAEEMHVQVVDFLAGVVTSIYYYAVAIGVYPLLHGQVAGYGD